MLEARGVTVRYGTATAVHLVSVEAQRGELIGLIGPNGAGKTSLIKAMARLVDYEGRVELGGQSLEAMSRRTISSQLAYLPQGHVSHWPMTVRDVVALGRLPHRSGLQRLKGSDVERIEHAMVRVGVVDFAGRNILSLSEGERARVMVARALAVDAPVLLADEPTAALDPYHQLRIMELLRSYAEEGAAVIAVLHELTLAGRFCHRMLLLDKGIKVAEGPPADVLSDEHLEETYHIKVVRGRAHGEPYSLPWSTTPSAKTK